METFLVNELPNSYENENNYNSLVTLIDDVDVETTIKYLELIYDTDS